MDHIHINCFCHCHWCSRLVRCTFFSIFVLCDNRSKTERRSSLKKSESSSSCCNNENPSQPVCKVAHLHSQNGKSFTAGSSAGPTPERAAVADWSRNPVSVQWLGDWTVVLGRWGQSAGGSNANQRWWSQMELNIDFFIFILLFVRSIIMKDLIANSSACIIIQSTEYEVSTLCTVSIQPPN